MKNVKTGHARPVVCLDAGHYAKYNRSPVVPDYYESEAVWALHNYLANELEGYGIEVKQTRKNLAKDLELTARGKASKGCDLFISLHSNACGTESVDRPVAIYLVDDDCGAIDEQSAQVATLLAETVQRVMQTKGKAQTYSRKSDYDRDGDGKKNDDYYGVLYGCHQVGTAGIILEHSFHTNTRAAKWLLDKSNLQGLAKAEAAAIAYWFDVDEEDAAPSPSADAQDKPQTVRKLYRVRKSWEDVAGQLGAYSVLENAVRNCPAGYNVYDWDGKEVHAGAVVKVTVEVAKAFDKAKAGTYKVKSGSGLNLRTGAGAGKSLIEAMPNGALVKCYGYHTGDWYYVKASSGAVGFCHSGYLVKV